MTNNTKYRKRLRQLLQIACAAGAVGYGAAGTPSWAIDATWDGPANNWNTGTNWVGGTQPDNVASFDQEGNDAPNLTLSANADINQILFKAGATNYTIETGAFRLSINSAIAGTGITNTSTVTQTFNANNAAGILRFTNNATIIGATPGNPNNVVQILSQNDGTVSFEDASSAGSAQISNTSGGKTNFSNTSNAGNANIFNGNGGSTNFNGTSQAGDNLPDGLIVRISNVFGSTNFNGDSHALDASISNLFGTTTFDGNSHADTATITNTLGSTIFKGNSHADNASIINFTNGSTFFSDAATADGATIENGAGGSVDISGTNAPGIGIGNLFGAGNIELGTRTLRTGMLNQNATISGDINGTGGFTKEGTGVLTIAGNNKAYTGATTVQNGTLNLTTQIISDTTVGINGRLTGNGFIGDFGLNANTLTNNGIVDAGNGTTGEPLVNPDTSLFVTGNFNNNASGRVVSRVTGNGTGFANSNSIIGQADINLNGGEVQANVTSTDPNGIGTNGFGIETRVVVAGTISGIVNGTFATLDDTNVPTYLDASLDYTAAPNVVLLLLRRNTTGINTISGLSFNQRNVGEVLEDNVLTAGPAFFDLYDSVLLSSNPKRALSIISGDALTSFPLANQQAAMRFSERVRQHLLTRLSDGNEMRISALPSARLAYTGTRFKTLLAANPEATASMQANDAARRSEMRRSNIWASIAGARDNVDGDGNGPRFDARATEYQVGYDRAAGKNTVVGVSVGRSNGRLNVDDRNANGDFDTTSIGLYASHDNGADDAIFWNGSLSYNRHNINSRRDIVGGSARADYDGSTIGVEGEVGKRFGKGSYAIEPNLTLKFNSTRQDSFNESGGPGALRVDGDSYSTRRVGIGVRFVGRKPNARIRPNLSLSYEHEFGDTQSELSNQLIGLGSSFTVRSTDLGSNIFRVSLGADARLNDRFSLTGQIGMARRSNQHSEYIYGGMNYGF